MADFAGTLIEFPGGSHFTGTCETDWRQPGTVQAMGYLPPSAPDTIREEPMLPRREP